MKGRFALDALYPPHYEGSVVLGSVEACFFSILFLVINTARSPILEIRLATLLITADASFFFP